MTFRKLKKRKGIGARTGTGREGEEGSNCVG
jgi:hypothetical protein